MLYYIDVLFSLICFFKGKIDEIVYNRFNFLYILS